VNLTFNRTVELNGAMEMDDAFERDVFAENRKIATLVLVFLFVPHDDDPLLNGK
jgi:hypothetical protein